MNLKKFALLSLFALLIANAISQTVPYGINYQAVARNSEGYPISNSEIVLEISILKGVTNQIVWQETHIGTTDKFGLLNIILGNGESTFVGTSPDFKSIDWGNDKYFVKVRADFGDEDFVNGMVDLGTTQLQSVPYAILSARALEAPLPKLSDVIGANESNLNLHDGIAWNGSQWQAGSFFLLRNGTADLTGDWTIANNSITLNNGTLTAKNLKTKIGASISEFSTDDMLGNTTSSDNTVSTQKAVKTYVDLSKSNIITYVDNKFANTWIAEGSNLYNLTRKIGIGISTPADKFHAAIGTGGFLVTGTYSYSEALNTQTGSTMMYFPSRAAFRAGYADASQWSNAKIGEYSAAFGRNTEATGGYSFAFGLSNVASGTQSLAGGVNNTASQPTSVVFGQNNKAEGRSSFVMGENLIADTYLQVVFGRYNQKKAFPGPDPINFQTNDLLFVIGYGTDDFSRRNAFTVMKNGNIGIKTNADNPPTATFEVNGSQASTVHSLSSNTTLDDTYNTVLVNASAGVVSITLPDPTACDGREYTIKKIDATANLVMVNGGTFKIDAIAIQNISAQWGFIKIISDGLQWYIIAKN